MDTQIIIFGFLLLIAIILLLSYLSNQKNVRQQTFIKNFAFQPALRQKVGKTYSHLTNAQLDKVMDGLRDYFLFCQQANSKMVSMPSQVVDVAWHEFILFTRQYDDFSTKAFGRFLHHTPTEAMTSPTLAQTGIKRVWRLACAKENISPSAPDKLPLLFAIDKELEIHDGFTYHKNCKEGVSGKTDGATTAGGYCGSHIGCASGCAGDSGNPESDSDGGSGGDSDGGSSCGSGCGGD